MYLCRSNSYDIFIILLVIYGFSLRLCNRQIYNEIKKNMLNSMAKYTQGATVATANGENPRTCPSSNLNFET